MYNKRNSKNIILGRKVLQVMNIPKMLLVFLN